MEEVEKISKNNSIISFNRRLYVAKKLLNMQKKEVFIHLITMEFQYLQYDIGLRKGRINADN